MSEGRYLQGEPEVARSASFCPDPALVLGLTRVFAQGLGDAMACMERL